MGDQGVVMKDLISGSPSALLARWVDSANDQKTSLAVPSFRRRRQKFKICNATYLIAAYALFYWATERFDLTKYTPQTLGWLYLPGIQKLRVR